MKKILLLIPQNIIPVTDGGKQGLYYPMKILGQHYNLKAIVFVGQNEKYSKEDYKKINVDAIFLPTDKADKPLKIIANIFKKLPFKFDRYFTKNNINNVIDICKNWKPEIVICHHAHLALYGKIISKQFPNIQLILREHNIEYIIVKQFAQTNNNYLKKIFAYWQYKKAKKFEQQCWSWFNKVLFISNSDISIAKQVGKNCNHFYLIPDGSNLANSINHKKQNAFLFAGTLSTLQNAFNLTYFINKIWIPWKKEYNNSSYELWISGNEVDMVTSKVNIDINDLAKNNIKILGFVDDIQLVIQSAKFFLSPTIIGAGIRMKVLEAMCNGSVIFLTEIDKKMLDILNDSNVVEYNSAIEFNSKFNSLISDDFFYNSISTAAYSLAFKELTWDSFNRKYLEIISSETNNL